MLPAYLTLTMSKRSRRRAAGLEMGKNRVHAWQKMVLVAVGIAVFVWVLSLYKGLPIAVLLMIVLVVVLQFLPKKTKTGRHIYAVGGNEQAAYCAGINVNKTNMIHFCHLFYDGCRRGDCDYVQAQLRKRDLRRYEGARCNQLR